MRRVDFSVWALSTLALTGTASVAQPLRQSMAECSALYAVSAAWVTTPAKRDRVLALAEAWRKAALDQGRSDRLPDPESAFAKAYAAKVQFWQDAGPTVVFKSDYADWASYCRSLGRSRGIASD